jgi:hypothetical protein
MMGKATFDTGSEAQHNSAPRGDETPIENTSHSELIMPSPGIEWSLLEPGLQHIPESCRDYIRYCEALPVASRFRF